MAYDRTYLSSAGAQSKRGTAPQQFTYKTADSRATVLAASYISGMDAAMFSVGDTIDIAIVDSVTATTTLLETMQVRVTNVTSAGVTSAVSLVDETFGPFLGCVVRVPVFFNQTDLLLGGTGGAQHMPCPVTGTIKRLISTVQIQVTTGGVLGIDVAGTTVAGLTITIADGATVGTTQTDTPTATTRVTAGQDISFTATTAFATAGAVHCVLEIIPDVDSGDLFVPFYLNASDLSSAVSQFWPCPIAGQIIGASGVVTGEAIVTGGAITFELGGSTAVVGLTLTFADAAALGTVVTDTPTDLAGATGVVARNVSIEAVPAAAFNGGGRVSGFVQVRATNKADIRGKYFSWFSANQTDVLAPTSHYVPSGARGYITRASTAVQLAVGTGGNVTFEQTNVVVVGLTVVVANSATVGTVNNDVTTSLEETALIADASHIEIAFDAAFATSGALNGVIEVAQVA